MPRWYTLSMIQASRLVQALSMHSERAQGLQAGVGRVAQSGGMRSQWSYSVGGATPPSARRSMLTVGQYAGTVVTKRVKMSVAERLACAVSWRKAMVLGWLAGVLSSSRARRPRRSL